MKKKTLNLLFISLIIIVCVLGGTVYILAYLDKKETERVFYKELSLFDKSIGTENRQLLVRSLRSLYPAVRTADGWLRISKRAYTLGTVYDDYSLYLETTQKGIEEFKKNPLIHKLFFDAVIRNKKFSDMPVLVKKYGIPDGSKNLITLAYIHSGEKLRSEFPADFPFKECIDNPDEESLTDVHSVIEDARLLLDISISQAIKGDISEAVSQIPFSFAKLYPEAYSVLYYDAGKYKQSIQLLSVMQNIFPIMPVYFKQLYYDALFLSSTGQRDGDLQREKVYEGYRDLYKLSVDWRPGLNLLLKYGAANNLQLIKDLEAQYSHVPEVNRYLGDYWFKQGAIEKSRAHYQNLVLNRPDIIEANIRLMELSQGFITPGTVSQILWDIYYSDDPNVTEDVRDNAVVYLLWYAMGAQDSGVIEFFSTQEHITAKQNLLIALWELTKGNPERTLDRLDSYSGVFSWYSDYLKGTACIAMANYQDGIKFLNSALNTPGSDKYSIRIKIAECFYYSGEYMNSYMEIQDIKKDYKVTDEFLAFEKKVVEKL